MKIARKKNNELADIDFILDDYDKEYFCIHCGCEMVPAALDSDKVSPYFRAKNTHDENCPVKNILTRDRYNGKESEIEVVYENALKDREEQSASSTPSSSPDRKRKESNYLRIRYLKQLVTFCLSNDIEETIGDKPIKSFFIDDRTLINHTSFKQNKIYLFGVRFKLYIDSMQSIVVTYPTKYPHDDILMYFYDRDVYYEIKNKVFTDKDEENRYKDIYVIAQLNRNDNIAIRNSNQFFFVAKNRALKDNTSEVEND